MHTPTTRLLDEISYFADVEPDRIKMYCPCCAENVDTVKRDCGIGYDDAWGKPMIHRDWRDTCVQCGDDNLEGARTENEIEEIENAN